MLSCKHVEIRQAISDRPGWAARCPKAIQTISKFARAPDSHFLKANQAKQSQFKAFQGIFFLGTESGPIVGPRLLRRSLFVSFVCFVVSQNIASEVKYDQIEPNRTKSD